MRPGLALVVASLACLLSAVWSSAASAETTLLAGWLLNGAAVTSKVNTEYEGSVVFEDSKAGLGVTCPSVIFVIVVGPNGETEVIAVLTLLKAQVTLTAPLLCKSHKFCEESSTDIEMSPEKLPWPDLLVLLESGSIRDSLSTLSYSTSCLVLGIKTSEECTATNTSYEVKNVTGGVELVGALSPNGTCTIGGSNAGEVQFGAGGLMHATTGETLSVSSE